MLQLFACRSTVTRADRPEKCPEIKLAQGRCLQICDKIRNCIVHASGKVKRTPKEGIRHLVEKEKGILISGTRQELREELQPLYLEDDMQMLKPEYCRQIIGTVHTFFEELCDALSLPELTVVEESAKTEMPLEQQKH